MLGRAKQEPKTDWLVVLSQDGTADVAFVEDVTADTVYAESSISNYAVPADDLRKFVGGTGRVYVLGADEEYITDVRRLAALQKSMVLSQITAFERPREDKKEGIGLKNILLYVLIGILLLAVIFK